MESHPPQEILIYVDHHTASWLLDSAMAPHVDAFMLYLFDCRYASKTIDNYLAGLTHFAHWITESQLDVKTNDEMLIQRFLDEHLPSCCCEQPAFSDAKDLHAALGHLVIILRANAVIADPSKNKALARLQSPETINCHYHPDDDALMQFFQAL